MGLPLVVGIAGETVKREAHGGGQVHQAMESLPSLGKSPKFRERRSLKTLDLLLQ